MRGFSFTARPTPWRTVDRLASRPAALLALPCLFGLGVALVWCLLTGIRIPQVHDEYGYLLAADTFAHGRLTNPPHPMWMHFESMHQLQQPTYQSMYPPAQGLMLAVGQLLGHPILGVWLGMVGMLAAIVWMLRAWQPPRWALLSSLAAAATLASTYWGNSYWGGAVAATGGALVFGALARIRRRPHVIHAAVMAFGLGIVGNARPFEGTLLAVPVALIMTVCLVRQRGERRRAAWRRFVLPFAISMSLVAMATGYYNFRVTRNPLRLPFWEHYQQYCVYPVFMWQKPRTDVTWNHAELRDFHAGWELSLYENHFPWPKSMTRLREKTVDSWRYFFGGWLALWSVLSVLPVRRRMWPVFLTALVGFVGGGLVVLVFPHYRAPIVPLGFVLLADGMRRADRFRIGRFAVGRMINVGLLAGVLLLPGWRLLTELEAPRRPDPMTFRQAVLEDLRRLDGNHLVIVSYGSDHVCHNEWVFNEADIDGAKVVWARSMGPDRDRALTDYFSGRAIWRLRIDTDVVRPTLVPAATGRSPTSQH
jgi:hypothetical protein